MRAWRTQRAQANPTKLQRPSASWSAIAALALLLIFAISACGGEEQGGLSDLEIKLTQEAGPQEPTAAAQTAAETPAETPPAPPEAQAPPTGAAAQEPIDTPVPVATEPPAASALTEAGVTATARAAELSATSAAAEAVNAASQLATTEAMAPIMEELAGLGVDPSQGQIGFVHPPISLEATEFESTAFANRNAFTVAQDFVMAADVTWESRFAESGCGFVVRSDGEEENPSQYIIGLTRGAEGHVLFAEQVAGEVDLDDVTDIYANGIDPRFEWQSGTTNRIAVIGRGQEFTIFSNGTRLGTITGRAGFEEGFVAFIAVNRSGGIKCDYDNAWLWKIN